MVRAILLGALALLAGCVGPFECTQTSDCYSHPGGRCSATPDGLHGYCAFPDAQCAPSGYRFDDPSAGVFAGQCVIGGVSDLAIPVDLAQSLDFAVPPPPTCVDGIKNEAETDIDCGGANCPKCPDGRMCIVPGDCMSSLCQGKQCKHGPTCHDGVQNQDETDVDCGGGTCPTCQLNRHCRVANDCQSNVCTNGVCAAFPAAPTLGAQIDRMGRAAINIALTDPFDTLGGAMPPVTIDEARDAYNSAADPSMWDATFHPWIRGNLAILDGLDGVCGNQGGANIAKMDATRYDLMASALADDELYVNTGRGTCTQYFGVELAALGIANTDCGGRTPLENTIDLTYSLLVTGLAGMVTNGILKADGNAPPMPLVFPFLGSAN